MGNRSDVPPLDLRSLGQVESPEVVRAALQRFRRRTLIRAAVVLAALGFVVWFRGFGPGAPSLTDRIESARGRQVGAVFHIGEATVILDRVADLGATTGLEWTVADPQAGQQDELFLVYPRPLANFAESGFGPSTRLSDELRVPVSGRLRLRLVRSLVCTPAAGRNSCAAPQRTLGRFTLDLADLGVPRELWR